jgi:DNA-binding transcriptional regulator YhcF (GntR family)
MKFEQELPIYLQIENLVKEKILHSIWKSNERIPSVREMASTLEVNPNTVMRTYEKLQAAGIIDIQRGLGYFINQNAIKIIMEEKMQKFKEDLPNLFITMKVLNIQPESLLSEYKNFMKQESK